MMTSSKTKLPPSGVEVFDPTGSQGAKKVLTLASVSLGGDAAEALLRQQEAVAQRLTPTGGASECEETRELLEEARNLVRKKEYDLLESEYDSLVDLMRDLYGRLDSGLDPSDLAPYDDPRNRTVGVIDYRSEEHLFVRFTGLRGYSTAISKFLGISESAYFEIMKTPKGRAWLFGGEDPSEWPPPEVTEEPVEEPDGGLASLWETPEVVDESTLPEATAYGKRDENGEWHAD